MTDEEAVNNLYDLLCNQETDADDVTAIISQMAALRMENQNNPIVRELPFVNMDANGIHDPDIMLMKDLFTGKEKTIQFDAIEQGKVAVSKDVYSLSATLNPQPIYLCTGAVECDVTTLVSRLCATQTRRIIENNFFSCNQIDTIPPSTIHTYSMSITHENFPLVWPLENVDYIVANTVICDPNTNFYFYIRKSLNLGSTSEQSSCTRALLFEGWIMFFDAVSKITRYLTIHVANVTQRGWGGMSNIWNKIFLNRALSLAENLKSTLGVPVETGDTNGVIDTLHVNNEQLRRKFASQTKFNSMFRRTESGHGIGGLKRLIYTSRFHKPIEADELEQIQEASVRNNGFLKVTGILMISDQLIYQVLEGDERNVDKTFERILLDQRHYDVQCVSEEFKLQEHERQYPNWSMKIVNLNEYHNYFGKLMEQFLKNGFSLFDLDTACVF